MSNNPFSDPPNTNPYASPVPPADSGSSANPLLIPAIILLVLSLLFVLLIVASLPNQMVKFQAIDTSTPDGTGEMIGFVGALIMWPLMSLVIAFGAISMIRLKGYASAYTAAILAVIPGCSPCFILGIPFGIWAIIVLNRPDVKQRFLKK
jgi:hypothetical protein